GASPSLSPLGVIGPPMKTHDRKPDGKTRLPSFVNTGPLSPDRGLTAAINKTLIANLTGKVIIDSLSDSASRRRLTWSCRHLEELDRTGPKSYLFWRHRRYDNRHTRPQKLPLRIRHTEAGGGRS